CQKVSQNCDAFRVDGRLCNESVKFGQLLRRRVAALKPGSTFELANEWEQSTVGMMRRAEITQCDVRLTLEPLAKRERNVRLADTWLPRKHHHSAFLLRRVSPPAQQQLDLLFTPEQRRQLGLVHRLEAALHAACPQHLPHLYRLRPAFQRERAATAVIEVPSREPTRLRADQHCPWLRDRLQARGEVRRLAGDRLFRRDFIDQQLAYNDGARRNANANL